MSADDEPIIEPRGTNTGEPDLVDIFIDGFPEPLLLFDTRMRPLRWNRRAEEVSGYSPDEIVQKRALEFFPPEDRPTVEDRIKTVFAEGHAQVEAHLLTKQGESIPYLFSGRRVVVDGEVQLLGFGIDIRERKRTEEALRASETHYRAIVEQSIVGVYVIEDGLFSYVNGYLAAVFGYREEEIIGHLGPLDLIVPEDRDNVRERIRQRVEGEIESAHYTARGLRKDGTRLWVEIHGTRIDFGSGPLITGTLIDITQRKEAEDKARRLAERLSATLESITDAFYTVDRDWRVTYLNGEAERVLGRSRREMLGEVLWDWFDEFLGTPLEDELRRALRDHESTEFEFWWARPQLWHEYHVYPSEEGLAVYFRDITRRKLDEERIEFLALYDPLTGLPNRRLLSDRLQHAIHAAARTGGRVATLFLDLDDFKAVNDAFGHDTGDSLLQQVATRLTSCLRSNDTVARFGGDEFAVVLVDLPEDPRRALSEAARVGEKVRDRLAESYNLAERQYHGSGSIGVAVLTDAAEDASLLLKRADLAMYRAKERGRNNVRLFEPEMETRIGSRIELEAELREALEQDAIEVHYQPQVDAAGRVTGAEGLARWQHPGRGAISPAEFIPVAEQSGLIIPLGRAVIERACRQLARWARNPATAGLIVSVNVSARQLHHPRFVEEIIALQDRYGVAPGLLRLELTESVLLENIEDTRMKMAALQPRGIRFSLDDFGTGYSSLTYLKNFPLDRLKIDQSFVREMTTDPNDAAIARAVIAIARSLDLGVIAEGVETEEARALLEQYGCRDYQGFLFGRPMPSEEFERSLADFPAAGATASRE